MSTTVRARLAQGNSIDDTSFADLTPSAVEVAWGDGGLLEVTFADDLDAPTRRAVRCRIIAHNPAEEKLMATLSAVVPRNPSTPVERALVAIAALLMGDDS